MATIFTEADRAASAQARDSLRTGLSETIATRASKPVGEIATEFGPVSIFQTHTYQTAPNYYDQLLVAQSQELAAQQSKFMPVQPTLEQPREPKIFTPTLVTDQRSQAEREADSFFKDAGPLERGIVRAGVVLTDWKYRDAVMQRLANKINSQLSLDNKDVFTDLPSPSEAERSAFVEARQTRIDANTIMGESPFMNVAKQSFFKAATGPGAADVAMAGIGFVGGTAGVGGMITRGEVQAGLLGLGVGYSAKEGFDIGSLWKEGKKGAAVAKAMNFVKSIAVGEAFFRAGRAAKEIGAPVLAYGETDVIGKPDLKPGEVAKFYQSAAFKGRLSGKDISGRVESFGDIGIKNTGSAKDVSILEGFGDYRAETVIPTSFAGKKAKLIINTQGVTGPFGASRKTVSDERVGMGDYFNAFTDSATDTANAGIGQMRNLMKQTELNIVGRFGRYSGGTNSFQSSLGRVTGKITSPSMSLSASGGGKNRLITGQSVRYNILSEEAAEIGMFSGSTGLKTKTTDATNIISKASEIGENVLSKTASDIASVIKAPSSSVPRIASSGGASMKMPKMTDAFASQSYQSSAPVFDVPKMGAITGTGTRLNQGGDRLFDSERMFDSFQNRFTGDIGDSIQGFKSSLAQSTKSRQKTRQRQDGDTGRDSGIDIGQFFETPEITEQSSRLIYATTTGQKQTPKNPPPTITITPFNPAPPRPPTTVFFPSFKPSGGSSGGRSGGFSVKRKLQYTPTVFGISTGYTIKKAPVGDVGISGPGFRFPVENRSMKVRVPLIGDVTVMKKKPILSFTGLRFNNLLKRRRR